MKTHVLVIDDDPEHREILSEALVYFQFKVKASGSGKDLRRILRSFRPALLLIDYRLPGENGVELCRKVKSEYKLSGLPIILMSAYSLEGENLEEFDCVLQKPLDLDELIGHVNNLLAAYKSEPTKSNKCFDQDQVSE